MSRLCDHSCCVCGLRLTLGTMNRDLKVLHLIKLKAVLNNLGRVYQEEHVQRSCKGTSLPLIYLITQSRQKKKLFHLIITSTNPDHLIRVTEKPQRFFVSKQQNPAAISRRTHLCNAARAFFFFIISKSVPVFRFGHVRQLSRQSAKLPCRTKPG